MANEREIFRIIMKTTLPNRRLSPRSLSSRVETRSSIEFSFIQSVVPLRI